MKRMLSILLALALLAGCASALAGSGVGKDQFRICLQDESGHTFTYIRIAILRKGRPVHYSLVFFINDEGYYSAAFSKDDLGGKSSGLTLAFSFGYSDSDPMQACLDVLYGNVEPDEEQFASFSFKPEFGKTYYYRIRGNDSGACDVEAAGKK